MATRPQSGLPTATPNARVSPVLSATCASNALPRWDRIIYHRLQKAKAKGALLRGSPAGTDAGGTRHG